MKTPTVPAPEVRAPRAVPVASAISNIGDLDLRSIWQTLLRKKKWILGPTLVALLLSMALVNMITPRYKSEARLLIDGRENIFLRPNAMRLEERGGAIDAEAVTSQVQLILSRDLAREIIKKNKLAERPEFDSVLQGVSPLKSLLALVGVGRDPLRLSPEERVLDAYFERLTAFAVDKSRVIVVEFQSRDPDLAAKVVNSIAEGYLAFQQTAKQDQARSAGQWLSVEIDGLRQKVAEAEAKVEEFRSKSSLFVGTNNTTLSNQQLGEINSQLNASRGLKSDAESRSRLIREMLQTGKPIEASEVLNSELVRRLGEQRVTLRAQLAEQSSTLLDGHPRIKELKAQITDLDRQLREEASKISRSLENDSRIAGAKVEGLSASLEQLKRQATSSNGQDVQLRALEREAKSQRDLLEAYLAKYREATTRETIESSPAEGRIISKGLVTNTPAFPKKLPIVLIVTLATLMLAVGFIATSELMRMTAPRAVAMAVARPVGAPAIKAVHRDLAAPIREIDDLAKRIGAGNGARKITMIGVGQNESVTLTALTLSRLLARDAKVVLVELSISSPTFGAISNDPMAPGLADLMLGSAPFAQIITKDKLSGVHLISAGRGSHDRTLFQSPRLTMALDALNRVYDYVVLDAGTAADLPAAILSTQAHAVVVPDSDMSVAACETMREQLLATGFLDVTMLSGAADSSVAPEIRPEVAAA